MHATLKYGYMECSKIFLIFFILEIAHFSQKSCYFFK